MGIHIQLYKSIALTAMLIMGFAVHGVTQDTNSTATVSPENLAPVIVTTNPADGEMNVDLGRVIEITFSSDMDEKSINGTTLLLFSSYADTIHEEHSQMMLDEQIADQTVYKGSEKSRDYTTGTINGAISYSNKVAVFTPDKELIEGTQYTFTVTSGVKSSENVALENNQNMSFTTIRTPGKTYFDKQNDRNKYGMEVAQERSKYVSPKNKTSLIELGKAGQFVILANKYVNNESGSEIRGRIGEASLANRTQKEKRIINSALQTTAGLNSKPQSSYIDTASSHDIIEAIPDMMSAFADAALLYEDVLSSYNNESFNNTKLTPGVHEWNDSLHIRSDVTLSGNANDVWVFKTSKNLTVHKNTVFTLNNGARANNVFWYVDGEVTIGKNAHFEGIILSVNEITLEKGAKLNGRMFSKLSITLFDNTITEPRNLDGQTSSTNKE